MTEREDDREAEWALAELSDLLADLQEDLEFADSQAHAYFGPRPKPAGPGPASAADVEQWPFDVTAYNTLVRYHAKRRLSERQVQVADDPDYDVKDVANLGIHIDHGAFRLRIRKSPDLEAPVPGGSKALQAFYAQETLVAETRLLRNLLVLWRPATEGIELRLVKPLHGETTRDSVRIEWGIPVPALAHERAAAAPAPEPVATLDDIDTIRAAHEADAAETRKDEDRR